MNDLLKNIENQLMMDEERQAYHAKIKGESYMRWLAFYYLGRREHSQKELREKLLAKDCDSEAVEALLIEFANEGYQSDERMTSALIKDSIGKKHGTIRIFQTLKKHGLTTISSASQINTWIADHNDFFNDLILNDIEENFQDDDNDVGNNDYEVDWLAQAVEARVRKYGDSIPTDPKEKARQLRFLQYRGFAMNICFDALKYDLTTVHES
ncbi:regulatory protein RecX [Faucicola mancuniensis]|uniref:regulatory protein RecX n=1 Tax=Faucicola mancuniensis TaxID=1309795 RepID=UPI0039772B18